MKKQFPFFPILISVFFLLVTPLLVDGFALDLAIMQLEAISEKTSPFFAFFILVFIIFTLGLAALYVSTSLLQSIIEVSPEALTVMGENASPLIQVGWHFTVGIGNMFLLIAFVVIALSTIMGYENYHFKKLLPRLIIVAFLMNFTLLFVGIGIDVSNFLFNSVAGQFAAEGNNILFEAISPLLDLAEKFWWSVLGMFGGIILSLLVPYINVVVQVLFVVSFAAFLPTILELLITGIIIIMFSLLFFTMFVVFLARIFIVQILAIIAPLAFFCLIFDETKKYWTMWLTHLVQWLFVGVAFIFFMYIGLALAPLTGSLIKPLTDHFPLWLRFFGVNASSFSHIVLLVYFLVIFSVVKKFIPAAATAIISQGAAMVKAASPYVGAIAKGGKNYYGRKIAENEKSQKKYSDWSTSTVAPGSNIFSKAHTLAKRRLGTRLGPELQQRERERVEELSDKMKTFSFEKLNNTFRGKQDVSNLLRGFHPDAKAVSLAAALAAQKKERWDDFVKANPDILNDTNKTDELFSKAKAIGKESELKVLLPAQHMERELRGVAPANQQPIIDSFLLNSLKGDKMEKAAPGIVNAINNGTYEQKQIMDKFFNSLLKTKDISYVKNFMKGADGVSGVNEVNNFIEKETARSLGKNNPTEKEKYNHLETINAPLAEKIKKDPSAFLIKVDPT